MKSQNTMKTVTAGEKLKTKETIVNTSPMFRFLFRCQGAPKWWYPGQQDYSVFFFFFFLD